MIATCKVQILARIVYTNRSVSFVLMLKHRSPVGNGGARGRACTKVAMGSPKPCVVGSIPTVPASLGDLNGLLMLVNTAIADWRYSPESQSIFFFIVKFSPSVIIKQKGGSNYERRSRQMGGTSKEG